MYVYRVTHLPTGKYYLGVSTLPKNTFDPAKDYDPHNQFEVYGSNGTKLRMVNVEKRIICIAGDENELANLAAEQAKICENDFNFLGLKGIPTPSQPKVEPVVTPTSSKTTSTTT